MTATDHRRGGQRGGQGKRVAVQAKFHSDPERTVTQRDVATFFSFRSDLFERWWIVSNAVGRSANAEKATAGRGDVSWVHRDDLVANEIDWSAVLDAVSGRARPEVEPADPREPDQTAAIADTLEALKDHERAQLIMACGTGKTLVTRWIAEARKDRLVLVLVPTLLLLKQFRTQWREQHRATTEHRGRNRVARDRASGRGRPNPRTGAVGPPVRSTIRLHR